MPVAAFHSPTPIAMRTVLCPGFQSWWGTSTSICRRYVSTVTAGAGPVTGVALPACTRSATSLDPDGCTVRNRLAGATTFAPSGNAKVCPGSPPRAIENAISDGFSSVLSVMRKAVELVVGLTRNSTRSAASLLYPGPVGYVYVPLGFENVSPEARGSVGSSTSRAP